MTVAEVRNRLRDAEFKFHRQADRVDFYKRRGSTLRVAVPRCDRVPASRARLILLDAGLTQADVAEFLQHCVK